METVRELLETHQINAEPVTPRHIVEALPLTEARDEIMVQELRVSFEEAITVPDIEVDYIPPDRELFIQRVPAPVTKTRVTYLLDDGVQLSGDPDVLAQLFIQPPHVVDGKTEFTIRTSTFRPSL
jgi:hypothetical protein